MAKPRVRMTKVGWEKLRAKLDALGASGAHARVGILSDQGGNEKPDPDSPITMIELAAIQEFGSPAAGVPQRSFIRRTFKDKRKQTRDFTKRVAIALINDQVTVDQALEMLGQWGANEVRKLVTHTNKLKPNEESTIARKGSDRPLVDNQRMIGAVTYKVER